MLDSGSGIESRQVTLHKAGFKDKPTVQKNTSLQISDNETDALGQGHEGKVTRVAVPVGEKSSRLAYKQYASERDAKLAFEVWKRLKAIGVPVPATFRLVQQGDEQSGILMTDLTHGWRDIFISSNSTKMQIISQVLAHNPSIVELFHQYDIYDPETREKLEKQMKSIADITAKNKIKLKDIDVISAVFKNDREMSLIISDMGSVSLDSQDPFDKLYKYNYDTVSCVKAFIESAQRVASYLRGSWS